MEINGRTGRWYQHWWGVVLLSFGIVVLLLVSVVGVLTGRYWWQLKQGKGTELAKQFTGNFTASLPGNRPGNGIINRAALETADDPWLGRQSAPIVIVEFIDFKCPNCKRALPIMRQVLQKYGDKIRFIVRDLPVESAHPGATELAELASCALSQERFWPLYEILYAEQEILPVPLASEDIERLAIRADLNVTALRNCFSSAMPQREVQQDYLDALHFGVQGTPTFFINGHKVEGVVPFETWEKILSNSSQ